MGPSTGASGPMSGTWQPAPDPSTDASPRWRVHPGTHGPGAADRYCIQVAGA
jgi:hypothetical protein